jgi:hypothetical protein
MRILIVSDHATRRLEVSCRRLRSHGHRLRLLLPDVRGGFRLPFCGLKLVRVSAVKLGREMDSFLPDAIHIIGEGPMAWAARRWCARNSLPFSSERLLPLPQFLLDHFHRHDRYPFSGDVLALEASLIRVRKPARRNARARP